MTPQRHDTAPTPEELRPTGNTKLSIEELVEVWRYLRGYRIPCTFPIGSGVGFDYIEAMEMTSGVPIKDGYYVANHADFSGAYLGPDWNEDAVPGLLARNYATQVPTTED
jgi:hypothetical protein